MSDKQNREEVKLNARSATDIKQNVTEIVNGNASLRAGLMLVSYNRDGKSESASITLDRDRDGQNDVTLQVSPQGGTYFTTGDKPVMAFTPEDGARLTAGIQDILKKGGTDIQLYRDIANFLENPDPQKLPKVQSSRELQ